MKMKSINLAKIAASSLAFASVLVGGGSVGGGVMSASAAAPSQNIGQAATQAKNAQKALAKGQADKAVKFAEACGPSYALPVANWQHAGQTGPTALTETNGRVDPRMSWWKCR